MRKIIVPTDFSENANDALRYAFQLAAPFGAEIVLTHIVLEDDFPGTQQNSDSIAPDEEQQLRERLDNQAQAARSFADVPIALTTRLIRGSFVKAVLQVIDQEQCDLVILGTRGASGLRKAFVGSNTTDLMEYTHIPLIAVPDGYSFSGIKSILYSLDMNNPASFGPHVALVGELAKAFQAEVVVLTLGSTPEATLQQAQSELGQALADAPVNYEIVAEGNPIRTIEEYTQKLKPQMLVLQPLPKSVWQLFFGKSVTREILFRPEVPVLTMPHPHDD